MEEAVLGVLTEADPDAMARADPLPEVHYPLLGVYIFRLIQIGISGKDMYDIDGLIHRHFVVQRNQSINRTSTWLC